MISLWGEEFTIKEDDVSSVVKKVKSAKKTADLSLDKALKSKTVMIKDKIRMITDEVYRILGSYQKSTEVIRDYDRLKEYIDKAISYGEIAVDTETNNTIDIFGDCKLMGLCLYVPGEKSVYVPVNHVKFNPDLDDPNADLELLDNQITESQIAEQLRRLVNTNCIFHNATFDIEVLYKTCNVRMHAYWDTMVGAQLLDENELKGLKVQYKLHINPEQDKYDIEHLFKGLPYAIFDPALFALYAATDSKMTMDLYHYQKAIFERPENSAIYELLKTVEIPVIDAIVTMETAGVRVDLDYAKKMSEVFHQKANDVQSRVDAELKRLQPLIDNWKLTPEANAKKMVYPAKKTKMTEAAIAEKFPLVDAKGRHYKMSTKTPVEQLSDPIDVGSTTQLQILLYDIMKIAPVDKSDPRGTGADILKTLAEEKHVRLCELLLEKRGVEILINTFIDAIPTFVKSDGRVHARFNQCGTATGRFSSSSPNLQQIPSHEKTIRMIFEASTDYGSAEEQDGTFTVKDYEEVECVDGWKSAKALVPGDVLVLADEGSVRISNVLFNDGLCTIVL